MQKYLLVFLVLAVIGLGGYLGWRYYNQSQASVSSNLNGKNNSFAWGVTTRPFALARYNAKLWKSQISLASDLGVGYVRFGWEPEGWYQNKFDPVGLNQALIAEIEKQGMKPYVGLGQKENMLTSSDPYTDGYNVAYAIATAEKGKVDYYQLENEMSSWSLKGGEFPGDQEDQYDLEKYQKIRNWLKGANAGVKKADPAAKTVVVGQWTQTAFFDMLKKDNVDFDIIGWDWFSDMGQMKDVKISDGTLITDKLKSFKKPVMLVEVGQRPDGSKTAGFTMDEDKQAQFISEMATWAYNSGFIKGFFAFELTDLVNHGQDGYIDRYGLVAYEKNKNGVGVVDHLRKVYSEYASVVKKYSK